MPDDPHPMTEIPGSHLFQAAFEQTAAARAALTPRQLQPINLDVQRAVITVLGAVPRLAAMREEVRALAGFDIREYDALPLYARALSHAHIHLLATSEPSPLAGLVERAHAHRDQLLSDARTLAKRGLLDAGPLDALKGGTGILPLASDLGVLVVVLRERWEDIASKCAITREELDEAESVAEQVGIAHARRALQPAVVERASDDRLRAYALLVGAYDQARRAATYLRWNEGDADVLVPSLWAGRGGRGRKAGGRAAMGEERGGGAESSTPRDGGAEAKERAGLPGGSPFAGD